MIVAAHCYEAGTLINIYIAGKCTSIDTIDPQFDIAAKRTYCLRSDISTYTDYGISTTVF